MLTWPAKDPEEVLDYSWAPALDEGDTIATFVATVESGTVAIDSQSNSDTAGTVWLSGGTDGETAAIKLTVTTSGGRTFEETAALAIVSSDAGFAADFGSIFPDFAAVSRQAINYWKTRAERVIDSSYGDDQAHATMLLTAHYLVMQGLGSSVEAQRAAQFAGATRIKSGSIELGWDAAKKTTGSRYGDELLAIIRANVGGPRVTATGSLAGCGGFNGYAGPLPPYGC